MHYYGTRLSENISRREPEGYLLCLNVPVARTGTQEYLPAELALPEGPGMIPVFRPPEEVFSPATIASFEGMPVTDGHPEGGVDSGNIRALQKGHAHNVRRGTGKESDLLLADLIITDPRLISAILEEAKREISCGYTYELHREKGRYIQREIRGNHVAVVDAGRAGSRVSIRDGVPSVPVSVSKSNFERSTQTMKKSLYKVLARMAKDGDIETVAGIIEQMIGPEEALPAETAAPAPETVPEEGETKNVIIDEDGIPAILERLDRILALLEPPAADETVEEEIAGAVGEALAEAAAQSISDPVASGISAAIEEVLAPENAEEPEPSGEEKDLSEVIAAGDALRAALTAVRPVLCRMNPAQRKRMVGDIAARLRRSGLRAAGDSNIHAGLASLRGAKSNVTAELGRRIMEKRNSACRRA